MKTYRLTVRDKLSFLWLWRVHFLFFVCKKGKHWVFIQGECKTHASIFGWDVWNVILHVAFSPWHHFVILLSLFYLMPHNPTLKKWIIITGGCRSVQGSFHTSQNDNRGWCFIFSTGMDVFRPQLNTLDFMKMCKRLLL